MSLNPNQWSKLVAQNRAKAINVSWTEEEMKELVANKFSQECADRLRGVKQEEVSEPKTDKENEGTESGENVEAPQEQTDPDNEPEEETEAKPKTKRARKAKTKRARKAK